MNGEEIVAGSAFRVAVRILPFLECYVGWGTQKATGGELR